MVRSAFNMKLPFLLILPLLVCLFSCTDGYDAEQTKRKIAELKKNYKGNYRRIHLDTADVVYISGKSFRDIENSLTNDVYCGHCDSTNAVMVPNAFFFDLEEITIAFEGKCTRCLQPLHSGYAMHKRIDYLENVLKKRKKLN